jgi:hypothetical protein
MTSRESDEVSDAEQPAPGTPRWVKTSAIVALVIAVIIVTVMLLSRGEHGPGRHSGGATPAATVAEPAPPGGHGP